MNNDSAELKVFKNLSVSFKDGKIILEFQDRITELSLKDWTHPEKIVDAAEKLGVSKGILFQKVSKLLDSIKVEARRLQGDSVAEVGGEEPVVLPHLNMVEDPAYARRLVVVDGVVASTSVAYLAPKEVEVEVEDRDGLNFQSLKTDLQSDDPVNIQLVGVSEDIKYRRLKRFLGNPSKARIREKAWCTIYLVRVRPPVFTLEKRGEKIIDERGFEYKAFDIYVAADQTLAFPASTLVRLKAKPLGSPRTQKTVLLADRVEFPEETCVFNEDKLRQLKAKLDSLPTVEERKRWILSEFAKFSGLVGRNNLAFAGLLAFFTPLWVKLGNEVQRGWGIVIFVGDTTTGKSETLRKLIMLLKVGMLITAETASTVGLVGTAMQLEEEGWFVDWGFLVLCDRKLLAIDGVHKLPFSCWAALAEAERTGVVTIAKAAKDSAYARTRQIKVANPVDREAEKWATKDLADFRYPVQALPTILDRTGIARLDLAVFAGSDDVKAEEVNKKTNSRHAPELELLSEALKWCWSGTAEIVFTSEALDEILNAATTLYNTFHCSAIPLISLDIKWKLARLSAALAFLTISTEDFKKVMVTDGHVKSIVGFIRDEYSKAGLNALAQEEHYEMPSSEEVEKTLTHISEKASIKKDILEKILRFIVLKGRVTRDQLKTEFELTENNQLRPLLAELANFKLIRSGHGIYSTRQLLDLVKVLDLTRLTGLTRSIKDPPENMEASEKATPSLYNHVNHVKLVKNEEEIKKPEHPRITSTLPELPVAREAPKDSRFHYAENKCEKCGSEKYVCLRKLNDASIAYLCDKCWSVQHGGG